jgi:hypothetical protein
MSMPRRCLFGQSIRAEVGSGAGIGESDRQGGGFIARR